LIGVIIIPDKPAERKSKMVILDNGGALPERTPPDGSNPKELACPFARRSGVP
jgi:hypothetical protein